MRSQCGPNPRGIGNVLSAGGAGCGGTHDSSPGGSPAIPASRNAFSATERASRLGGDGVCRD
jgi:hypothetical protein